MTFKFRYVAKWPFGDHRIVRVDIPEWLEEEEVKWA